MVEQQTEKPIVKASFIEKPLGEDESARCIDGRPSETSKQGPQMLGGSIHPMALKAIFTDSEINRENVKTWISSLRNNGFKTGAHRGSHSDGEKSDCGFADRLPEIIKTAQDQEETISQRLTQAYEVNKSLFSRFSSKQFHLLVLHLTILFCLCRIL